MSTREKLSCKQRCPAKVQLELFYLSLSVTKLRKNNMKTNQLMIEVMMLALVFSQLWPLGCSIIRASTSSALIDTFENTHSGEKSRLLHCPCITSLSADPQKTSDGGEDLKG